MFPGDPYYTDPDPAISNTPAGDYNDLHNNAEALHESQNDSAAAKKRITKMRKKARKSERVGLISWRATVKLNESKGVRSRNEIATVSKVSNLPGGQQTSARPVPTKRKAAGSAAASAPKKKLCKW